MLFPYISFLTLFDYLFKDTVTFDMYKSLNKTERIKNVKGNRCTWEQCNTLQYLFPVFKTTLK